MFEAIVLMVIGIIVIAIGIIGIKAPMVAWKLWIARLLFVKNGEPTDFYYWVQKKLGWMFVVLGICVMIAGGLQLKATFDKLTVTLDGKEVTLPCKYEDFEEIGYKLIDDDLGEIKGEGLTMETLCDENGKEIWIIIENPKKQPQDYKVCTVTAISLYNENTPVVGVEGIFDTSMSKDEIKTACRGMLEENFKGDYYRIDMSKSFEKYYINISYDKSGEDGIIESVHIYYED